MFMFRSRRTALAKRLWKARARRADRGVRDGAGPEESEAERDPRSGLLKRLGQRQLEMLTVAVETGEAGETRCVPLPRDLGDGEPQVQCCRTWRWPDLRRPDELKRMPLCGTDASAADAGDLVCCNPYHWSRICKPESPPPPYQRFAKERLKPEDRAPSESGGNQLELRGSLTTEDSGVSLEWCRLAYWELARRVGRQYPVLSACVNVFWSACQPGQSGGLSLESLAAHSFSPPPPDAVRRARDKIGRGLMLSLEVDGVWAYNRSGAPIFVNSPTLDDPESRSHLVFRVPPGHCLCVFHPGRPPPPPSWCRPAPAASAGPPSGPVDRHSVRISFAKGWGPKYSRQEVTACPAWLEVLLAPCR